MKHRTLLLWLTAIALALLLDGPVAEWVQSSGLPVGIKRPKFHAVKWLKQPGEYWYAGVMACIALTCWRRERLRGFAFVLLCAVSTLLCGVMKWLVGRARPYKLLGGRDTNELTPLLFQPLYGGWAGVGGVANLGFPSGHTATAFATAAGMGILFPQWRALFYALATLTGVERILENAHYLSDVVVAAALGVAAAKLLARWLIDPASETRQSETPAELAAMHP